VVNALITRNSQINHADISQHVTAVNRAFENPAIAHFWNPLTAAGRAALDGVITRQAQIIAYLDDYKLLLIATLAVIPLLAVFKRPRMPQPLIAQERFVCCPSASQSRLRMSRVTQAVRFCKPR
jgi:DHA2 family multidrug resistance protein